ncbi:MAG TPA: alanine--glyoxylate aminotransferase family protein [Dehalococcoidales bacterium]|nr:alanine--glyoxylate aminotransferase family protein [Dehalococcoidales bacterium]
MPQLRIPGPTPLPPEVLAIMNKQMINHRGAEFHAMMTAVTNNLKTIYQTKNDLLTLTGSGTGGLEAGIVNFLSPGDKILSVSIGVFGDRFTAIAQAFGANIIKLSFEMGKAADPEEIRKALKANPDIKAVLVTQNETSTGVTNDMQNISKVVHEFDKLLIMDGISGLSSIDCPVDAWNIDVAIGGSQKGWMVPPGLAFISVNQKGWDYFAKAKMPRFYWDLGKAKQFLAKEENPWTPAVNVIYGLTVSLEMILKEGLQNVFARHARIAKICRDEAKAFGLKLVAADEKYASNTVSSVYLPAGIEYKALSKNMREEFKITITGGQGALDGKIFRIGHLGWVSETEIKECMEALKVVMGKMGYKK